MPNRIKNFISIVSLILLIVLTVLVTKIAHDCQKCSPPKVIIVGHDEQTDSLWVSNEWLEVKEGDEVTWIYMPPGGKVSDNTFEIKVNGQVKAKSSVPTTARPYEIARWKVITKQGNCVPIQSKEACLLNYNVWVSGGPNPPYSFDPHLIIIDQ